MPRQDILPGYQLHVTTYYGDMDGFNSEIISGLSEADVWFLLDILSNFRSEYNRDKAKLNYGNTSADPVKLREMMDAMLVKHHNISKTISVSLNEYLSADDENEPGELYPVSGTYDWLCETLLGPTPEQYCDYSHFCQVFESFKVYYFPEIVEDVTQTFMQK